MPKRSPRPKSEYGLQLQEKQKIRNTYGLRERQFRRYFEKARGPEAVFSALERRLDNVVFRLGFALSRGAARQLVGHGHIMVNGRRIDIPSYQTRPNDLISIRPGSISKHPFQALDEQWKKYEPPSWLRLDKQTKEGTVVGNASLQETGMELNMKVVIEFYSR